MDRNQRLVQFKAVFEALYIKPMTMLECDVHTGIMRSNICWYCRDFKRMNKLFITRKRVCSITKQIVNEYTTNPKFAPTDNQYHLL